ncbi:MAG: MFS transporter [Nanoarchaeota archaeon]|nr:MFS transporter [Nanoarchaeota archaeon]
MVKRDVISKSGKILGKAAAIKHPIVQKKIEKSLKLSIQEGSLASVSGGLGLSYFAPFALAMNATSSQVGILHAIISLVPSVIQLHVAKLLKKYSRKKVLLTSVGIKLLLWVPILLTGLLFYLGVPYMVWVFIGLVGIDYAIGAIAHPAWFSLMGSLVPEEKRGKYFAKRNRIAGFFGLVTMIVGAIILDFSKSIGFARGDILGYTLLGFGILFVLAALIRMWSWTLLARHYEPKLVVRKKDSFSFWEFLKRAPSTPFGRFTLFRGFFSIAIAIAGPFWAVYMLRDLGFSYIWFIAITVSGTAFQLMFFPLMGKASDKFGNIKIMGICSGLMFLIPFLWLASSLISSNIGVQIYLLFVPAIVSGFAWSGYNLATNNYVYDAVAQRKQCYGVSYMNLLVGVGTFIGASIGSLIAWLGIPFMNTILFIFIISGLARLLVAIFGVKYLREVRHVGKFSSHYLIKEFSPMQGVVREVHYLEHIVEKVQHYVKKGEEKPLPKEVISYEDS